MTKLQRKMTTGIAAFAMIFNVGMPAFAGTTTLIISGNGSDSDNTTQVNQVSTTNVVQENNTVVENDIKVKTNTGDNDASGNTGGDVMIDTGKSEVKATIVNELNSNVAEIADCDCASDTHVEISGNGTDSDNDAKLNTVSQTQLWQQNNAVVDNEVDVEANTGKNRANDNTGGEVEIYTGDSKVVVVEQTTANMNSARILGNGGGSSVTLLIKDNGSDSDNEIDLALVKGTLLTQWNYTAIDNDVDVKSNTGDNVADDNTGGSVLIDTGNIVMKAYIDNMAGFNAADMGCDCVFDDVYAKIAGNGTDSDSLLKAALISDRTVFQDNQCGYGNVGAESYSRRHKHHRAIPCFDNDVDLDGYTGKNRATDNTGEGDDDPAIYTGNTDVEVDVSNIGGENVYGEFSSPWEWPSGWGSDVDVSFSFNLMGLLALLAGLA